MQSFGMGSELGSCSFSSSLAIKQAARQGCCGEKATVFGQRGGREKVCDDKGGN